MKFVARIYDIAAFCVKREIFFKQCSKCGFAGFAADVDFGCLIVLHLQFQFLSRTQDDLHHVFIRTITFHKNWRFNFAQNFGSMPAQQQRWKPVGSTGTGRVDWPVGLPVGSRFFDRPIKPAETPVKFSFLATTRHLSTNRKIHICFVINKTFYKKTVSINHTLPIGGRVDRASATETVDMGSIPSWVKPKTIKIGIHSFPA